MSYSPTVSEAIYPEDAGWTKEGSTNVLLLSIPLLHTITNKKINKFDYTWLYNQEHDAYIFCFRIQDGEEFAIFFQKDHAGKLLMEKEAYSEFMMIITDKAFDEIGEESPFIRLPKISLERTILSRMVI